MKHIYIKSGDVILKDRIVKGAAIAIDGCKVSAVGRHVRAKRGSAVIDAKNCFVSPGFIDCHIHGEPGEIFFNEAKHGTTAFVIAESCAPLNYIYERAESIKKFIRTHPFGPNLLGLRLEGPYISKERAGAQNTSYIRRPDIKELSGILKKIPILKMMTIAPEIRGAKPLIKLLCKHKIIASIGHSDATYESAIEGIDAGITHSTHTFNAMSGIDPSTSFRANGERSRTIDRRFPGVAGAVLMDDRVTAEIIPDLIHVHKVLFGLLLKLKKRDKVILVTDSLTALDCFGPSGLAMTKGRRRGLNPAYGMLGGVRKTGGAYRFSDGRLAGSSLTMIGALKNAVKSANLSLQEALNTITLNPAKLLGIEEKKGSIAAGKDADIVVFDKGFDVKMTMIRGRIAYKKN